MKITQKPFIFLLSLILITTAQASQKITNKPVCHTTQADMESTEICTYKSSNLSQV